jgi:hypothetical protein
MKSLQDILKKEKIQKIKFKSPNTTPLIKAKSMGVWYPDTEPQTVWF